MDTSDKSSSKNRVLNNAIAYLGKTAKLSKSSRKGKKWMIETPSGKRVHFGASDYTDYTQHQDNERQKNYLRRSAGIKGDWKADKYSPNNLAREILWR